MTTVDDLCRWLEVRFPPRLAEDWDNVGLLLGDRAGAVTRVMTCLTLTDESCEEAIRERVELVVSHHPLPFRPVKSLTSDSVTGRLIWKLARAGVSVYSPHTAFDSAAGGINQQLAARLGLSAIAPLVPATATGDPEVGAGRWGRLAQPCTDDAFGQLLKSVFPDSLVRQGPTTGRACERVAVACGSGGSLISGAADCGCDTFVTGEATFHSCLEAASRGINLFLVGHHQSERFAVEWLAGAIAGDFNSLRVWASRDECDPLSVVG
jgi:dinuclear metal center YbgI/SA1388 family protein